VEPSTTFCCVQCRLLQAPTVSCAECGTPMVAPVELVRELLQYRDMKMVSGRDWAFITAMIAGGSIAFPMIAPVALGSMVVLGISKLRELRMRRVIAGVELAPPPRQVGARLLIGMPRKFRSTVPSLVDDRPVLLEHAMVRDRDGAVLIRRSAGTPFLIEPADGPPVLVTGAARLLTPGLFGRAPLREPIRRGDRRLARMGVPPDLAISGELEVGSLVEDQLIVAVTGVVEEESVAELAFHRDGGRVPVMRGRAGAPVIVEDRRLIAASLLR
jgi:hypothetical protein